MSIRIEHDTMGEVEIDASKFWGAQTERSRRNFRIGSEKMPVALIEAFAHLKWVAAETNLFCGNLSNEICESIKYGADEILQGDLREHFPLVGSSLVIAAFSYANRISMLGYRLYGKLDQEHKLI